MKKIIVFVLSLALVLGNGFMVLEGVVASADTVSTTATGTPAGDIGLGWDATLDISAQISLECDTGDVVLPELDGMVGGISTGTRACTIVTNNEAGYIFTVRADHALMATTSDGAIRYIGTTTPNGFRDPTVPQAHDLSDFGFRVDKTNGTGTGDVLFPFTNYGIMNMSTTDQSVASSDNGTEASGEEYTVLYVATVGESGAPSGDYTSHTTVTTYMQ